MRREKGSFTVEATIVMTTILFILFAIVSSFLLLYQNAVLYYVASQAAQQGAVMWTDTSLDLDGVAHGANSQGVYYRIGELFSANQEKTEKIQQWAQAQLRKRMPGTLVGSGAERVNVTFQNTFFQRFVTVEITKEIDIPFAQIAQYFSDDLDLHISVTAAVSEPAEYIRNIDYGIALSQEVWALVSDKFSGILKALA